MLIILKFSNRASISSATVLQQILCTKNDLEGVNIGEFVRTSIYIQTKYIYLVMVFQIYKSHLAKVFL